MDNDVILELRDVSKIYESVNALSNINLKVKKVIGLLSWVHRVLERLQ